MLWIRTLRQGKVEWQLGGERSEAMLTAFEAGTWQGWVFGSASAGLIADVHARLARGEHPRELAAPLREKHDGHYALMFLDAAADCLVAIADPYAIAKLYVARSDDRFIVGSSLLQLLAWWGNAPLHETPESLAYFFVTGYTPARHTFWREIEKIPPATVLSVQAGTAREDSYLGDFSSGPGMPAEEYLGWFEQHWNKTLAGWRERFDSHSLFLSGGVDSTVMLDTMLRCGFPAAGMRLRTIQYRAHAPCPDNLMDVQCSLRVAEHYRLAAEVVSYDLGSEGIVDDWLRLVRSLGTESSFALALSRCLQADSANGCVYTGQNADSVLSFGTLGHPSFAVRPPFVKGLGGWCQRFYMFGGFHDGRFHAERWPVSVLLDRYLRSNHGVGLQELTTADFLLGIGVEPGNWPFCRRHSSFADVDDLDRLREWFWSSYIAPTFDPRSFEANPHGFMLWLYLQTYMQGAANRGTAWSALAKGFHVLLPFANLQLLQRTLRVQADRRFYWHGKYPNIHLAKRHASFPHWVLNRPDGAESYPVYLSGILRNAGMNAYLRALLEGFDPAQLEGVVKPEKLAKSWWQGQLESYERGNYAGMDTKVFPRGLWRLAVAEQAKQIQPGQLQCRLAEPARMG